MTKVLGTEDTHVPVVTAQDTTFDARAATASDDSPLSDDELAPNFATSDAKRYQICEEVGRGGIGRVLSAEDRKLGRTVAIKELRADGHGRARFLREAMVTARLQHPSIVPLYDFGRWPSGAPYYAMRLVSGRALDVVITQAKSLDERLALLPHIIAVADAIAYAHQQRIIHRDLKPSNVIVGEFGETVVIDWGLAKELDDEKPELPDDPYRTVEGSALTQAGEVVGTPVYMAPEQAMGRDVDERADVYAIGAMLYQLLTGTWPHQGASSAQVIAKLVSGDAVMLVETKQPGVPRDLATIVDTAMAFERDARYRSAAELATELRRFQTGQLVAAHRYSRATLLRRWIARHRSAVIVGATLVALLAATLVISVRSVVAERDATRAEHQRLILTHAAGELQRDPTEAVAWLKTYRGHDDQRARALALDATARGVAKHVLPLERGAGMGRFSPDGRRFLQPQNGQMRLVDLEHGTITSLAKGALSVAWASDGQHFAAAQADRTVTVHDARGITVASASGELAVIWRPLMVDLFTRDGGVVLPSGDNKLRQYPASGGAGVDVWTPFAIPVYAQRGDRFASISPDKVMHWWDAAERVARALAMPTGTTLVGEADSYMLTTNGARLAAAATDGRLVVWSLPDGASRVLEGHRAAIVQVLVSRDGERAVTMAVDSTLRSWDLRAGTSRELVAPGTVNDISISADARLVAVGMQDHRVRIIDTQSGELGLVGTHPASVIRVALSSDGRWIASDGEDGTTRLWQLDVPATDQAAPQLEYVGNVVATDGRAATSGARPMLWIGDRAVTLNGHAGETRSVAFVDGERLVATGGMDQTIRLWDATTGEAIAGPHHVLEADGGEVLALGSTRRGIVSLHERGDVRVWDLASGSSQQLGTVRKARAFAVSPDGALAAIGDREGAVHVLALDGAPPRVLKGPADQIVFARFAPDGRTLATGSRSGRVVVWNVATGTQRTVIDHDDATTSIAFSPDGKRLVAGALSGQLDLVELTSGARQSLAGHEQVTGVAFTPTGMLSGGVEGTVRLWATNGTLRGLRRVEGHVTSLAVHGETIVVGASTGLAYRWRMSAFRLLRPLDELTDHSLRSDAIE